MSTQLHLLVFLKILYAPEGFIHKAEEKEEIIQGMYG
jgi:hypothetical protein